MKLYEAPRVSVLKLKHGPLKFKYEDGEVKTCDTFLFHHIDGMYSVCYAGDNKELLHLGASTDVEVVSNEWPEDATTKGK